MGHTEAIRRITARVGRNRKVGHARRAVGTSWTKKKKKGGG